MIDSDITALTPAADKVIRVGGSEPYLVNVELQSSHQTDLVPSGFARRPSLPPRFASAHVLVLAKRGELPSLTGSYELRMPDGRLTNRYDYRVVRLWGEVPSRT